MRAIAIVAVLLCHAGIPFAAGGYVGVDVFFVISGFLITRLLLNEVDRTRQDLAARLLRAPDQAPAAALGGPAGHRRRSSRMIILSPVRVAEVSGDIISSAFYVANWHFAAQSVDYFAQDIEPSPVLHLWSLAIEEQFYLVWPTLLLGRHLVLAPPRQLGPAGALGRPSAIVFVASLAFGIYYTERPAGRRLLLDLRPRLGARRWARLLALLGVGALPPDRGAGDRLGRARRRSSTRSSPSTSRPRSPGSPR